MINNLPDGVGTIFTKDNKLILKSKWEKRKLNGEGIIYNKEGLLIYRGWKQFKI